VQALQAIPYTLEDQFAEEIDTLHFAVGAPEKREGKLHQWPVASVALAQMQAWQQILSGLTIEALVPDTLALPVDDHFWGVLAEKDRAVVRHQAYQGFVCAPEDLDLYFSFIENNAGQGLRVLLNPDVETDYSSFERPLDLKPGYRHPLEALVRHYQPSRSINLLQGAFAASKALDLSLKAWKKPVFALLALYAISVLALKVEGRRLNQQAETQAASNVQRFQAAFPSETKIVDIRAQAETQYKRLSGGSQAGFLLLLDRVNTGLQASPASKTLKVKNLQFRDGTLFVALTGPDLQALDGLRSSLEKQGSFAVESATSGSDGVQIRIKVGA
jgi:general secretion pathway protein L